MSDPMVHLAHPIKVVADSVSVTVSVVGALGLWTGIVAFVSSILSLIWICIRIYETKTFQKIFRSSPESNPPQ